MNIAQGKTSIAAVPFDQARVDRLMEEAGIDVLFATSKHNVQYLLGGYKFIFFAAMDAIGHSRYLPIVHLRKGPAGACRLYRQPHGRRRAPEPSVLDAVRAHQLPGARSMRRRSPSSICSKIGKAKARIGIEPAFLPSDAYLALRKALPDAELVDATGMLERMRAIKTQAELEKLRQASELITDSMLATIRWARRGRDQDARSSSSCGARRPIAALHFEYCLLTLGSSHNRAVSPQAWEKGEVLSIDSGGNYHGYIGDLCRMGVLGEPDAELEDLLAEIETVQQAAFSKVRAGTLGGDMIAACRGGAEGIEGRAASPISSPTAWG